ncbi:MAG TPA: hypothetical protein VGV15_22820, partial [Terriglobales bacterium]|nr:hypothetical protein [Terriglobales bacterium]
KSIQLNVKEFQVNSRKTLCLTVMVLAIAVPFLQPAFADGSSSGGHTLFISSAVENANGTVTLPVYRGTSRGQTVYYVMMDASDGNFAQRFGLNTSQKLANAVGSAGVQKVTVVNGVVDFPASVDFTPVRQVTPGPQGFPPAVAKPGAVGESGYSPLIQMPNGLIVNAPQIANSSGQADKVVSLDVVNGKVTYRETDGFQGGDPVKYASFDSSDQVGATLEDVTYAPALNLLPTVNDDSTASARATLIAFVNGQTGANNPQRQGLNSAILDGLDPLNLLRWNPSQGRYSPMWDVNLAKWSDQIVAAGQNLRQTDVGTAQGLAQDGQITAPDGSSLTASGFIVNCPIVSLK